MTTMEVIKISHWSAPTADRMDNKQLNASKICKGGATKGNHRIRLVFKKLQFNDINAVDVKWFKNFKVRREIQGRDGYNFP